MYMLPTHLGCEGNVHCLPITDAGFCPYSSDCIQVGQLLRIPVLPWLVLLFPNCINVLYFNSTKNALVSNPAVTNNQKSENNLKIGKYDSTSWCKSIQFLTRSVTIILFPVLSLPIKVFLQHIVTFLIYKCKRCKQNGLQITEFPTSIFHSSCLSLSCQIRYCYSTTEQSKTERYLSK